MQVNGVSSTAPVSSGGAASVAKAVSNALDSDQFMQILLAQMTHQNPLEPMDNAEMMTQFSQLNSLQELREIHTGVDQLAASNRVVYLTSLIGKSVKVNSPDGKIIDGVVEEVITEKGNPQLLVDGQKASLDDVIEVKGESV